MLSHFVQLHAHLFGSMRALLHALMRLCICPGSSELLMVAYKHASLSY